MKATLVLALVLVSAPPLGELETAQADLHRAKVQLLSCQEQLVTAQVSLQKASLTEEQQRLEAKFRAILKAPADAMFDWDRLEFRLSK